MTMGSGLGIIDWQEEANITVGVRQNAIAKTASLGWLPLTYTRQFGLVALVNTNLVHCTRAGRICADGISHIGEGALRPFDGWGGEVCL